jgi:siroheme synthase-like protein
VLNFLKTSPKYYPIFISLSEKTCLIVGGGEIALRKINNLLPYSPNIIVVSPKYLSEIELLSLEKKITLHKRNFNEDDLKNVDIVFAATNDEAINEKIYKLCKDQKILINVVDNPNLCSFIVPAVLRRGPLQIAISTDSLYPSLSKHIKKDLEKIFDENYESYLLILSELREIIISKIKDEERKKNILETLIKSELFNILQIYGFEKARDFGIKLINEIMRDEKCI